MTNQIEVNKYEGHRQPWVFTAGVSYPMSKADMALRHDAPLILQALIDERVKVKLLRKQLGAYMRFQLWVQEEHNEIHDSYEDVDEL